jgi:uncharacterized membrane protein (DUF4010 family)
MIAFCKKWLKSISTLFILVILVFVLPGEPVDPWKILSLKKVATMILALTFIQVVGTGAVQIFGSRAGAILTGFFGGLISSTATTASLARKSKEARSKEISTDLLMFLSATAAMLFEGACLLVLGEEAHLSLLLIFVGPILMTTVMVFIQARKSMQPSSEVAPTSFKILPILKLSALILSILALSKLLQNTFGSKGLLVLTFLVSLFEIHGSVIANVQLHSSGILSVHLLGSLLAVSIVASYVSKLFLISTFGSSELRTQAIRSTLFLFLSLLLSWIIFYFYLS